MSRVHDVISRYDACRGIICQGIDIFAVADPAGAQLNAAVRCAQNRVDDDGKELWGNLLKVASALRWRRMTQPQPNMHNPALTEAVAGVLHEANLLRGFVSDEFLLDQITAAAIAIRETDSPVGIELLNAVQEVGAEHCVVVANKGSARAGLLGWLEQFEIKVVVPNELGILPPGIEQSYVVGPPVFFSASLVTAPLTDAITYVMPAWFGNRSVPTSIFTAHAERGIEISARIYHIGDIVEPVSDVREGAELEDAYYPQPVWGSRVSAIREPGSDEVEAWKVLLGGGLALWLDDGERIRSLDPRQPEGDRVGYEAVRDVQAGTYLALREGTTEHGAMYDAALTATGQRAANIAMTQKRWKRTLADRLAHEGANDVIAQLDNLGIRSAARVRAWTEPTLICPKHEQDFAVLLEWLGLPLQPTYNNAVSLRRALYKASADLRHELEDAVGRMDLSALERDGFMRLELEREGFRSMIVVRVLARAPFTEIIFRANTRVPFSDGGAQWLE